MAAFLVDIKHMILRFFYALAFLLFSTTAAASLFDQLALPNELKRSQTVQYSQPYQCIQIIDEYLQDHKKNLSSSVARVSHIREKSVTPSDIALIKQQKALCYFYANNTDQAVVTLDKMLATKKHNLPLHLRQQSLLIKSHILAQSTTLANFQLAQETIEKVLSSIDDNTYNPTANGYFALKIIAGEIALNLNNYEESMTLFREAKAFAAKTPLTNNAAWAAYAIGYNYQQQNKLTLAINFYNKAQQKLLDNNDTLNGLLTKKMSEAYIAQDNFKLAISFANQSAQYYQNLGNKLQLSDSLLALASMHRKIKEYNLSLVYYFNALDLLKVFDAQNRLNAVYFEVGKTYLQMGNYSLAKQYLSNAEQLFYNNGQSELLLEALVHLANLSIQQQGYNTALIQLHKALTIAGQLNNSKHFETVYLYLATAYEETDQYSKALDSYKQFVRYNKLSNFDAKKTLPVSNQHKENNEIKSQKIDQLQTQVTKLKQTKDNLIINVVLLASIMLVILYLYYVNNQKMKLQRQDVEQLEDNYNVHPNTGLNNINSLKQYIPTPLQEARFYSDWEYTDKQNSVHSCAIISLDFLQPLRQQYSLSLVNEIEAELGLYLLQQLHDSERLFQLNDSQLLLVRKVNKNYDPAIIANYILDWFEQFDCQLNFNKAISIGMVSHPFLFKYPTAIDSIKLLNIATLALSGATQLSRKHKQNSWVKLSALTYTQPAFFHGDIWNRSKQAIEKGLVKVTSSADKNDINWL
ncbi:MAG: tetratricopeptide (TPR) repeat protein [Moritella dasanensis]|jgi:tetratricopeptide (TPR) repeat protein